MLDFHGKNYFIEIAYPTTAENWNSFESCKMCSEWTKNEHFYPSHVSYNMCNRSVCVNYEMSVVQLHVRFGCFLVAVNSLNFCYLFVVYAFVSVYFTWFFLEYDAVYACNWVSLDGCIVPFQRLFLSSRNFELIWTDSLALNCLHWFAGNSRENTTHA